MWVRNQNLCIPPTQGELWGTFGFVSGRVGEEGWRGEEMSVEEDEGKRMLEERGEGQCMLGSYILIRKC